MTRDEMIEALENTCDLHDSCRSCPLQSVSNGGCINTRTWKECSDSQLKRYCEMALGSGGASYFSETDETPSRKAEVNPSGASHHLPLARETDAVEHPSHYTSGGIECIKAIEASMSAEEFQGYCKGNCLKYIWRYRQKNGVEDLRKAKVYLNWLIESLEKEEHT